MQFAGFNEQLKPVNSEIEQWKKCRNELTYAGYLSQCLFRFLNILNPKVINYNLNGTNFKRYRLN